MRDEALFFKALFVWVGSYTNKLGTYWFIKMIRSKTYQHQWVCADVKAKDGFLHHRTLLWSHPGPMPTQRRRHTSWPSCTGPGRSNKRCLPQNPFSNNPQCGIPVKWCATYLDLIALPGVESHPLIVLAGIGYFLVINPLNGCALQEGADLKDQIKEMPLDCFMVNIFKSCE